MEVATDRDAATAAGEVSGDPIWYDGALGSVYVVLITAADFTAAPP